jgi:hypothetical protein
MKHHEYANLFPMLSDAELQSLAADIAANGLQTPITTLDDMILDGRNRHRACEIAGVDPTFEEYLGGDPLAFVISHNLHRRHLTESQRGMVAAKMANLKVGNPEFGQSPIPSIDGIAPSVGVAMREAADMLNVGEATAQRSKKIQRIGSPELIAAVESGEVTVGAAYKVAELPHDEQAALVVKGPEAVKAKGKEAREAAKKTETTPARQIKPAGKVKVSPYKPDIAEDCWVHARLQLDRIHPNDTSREKVLREVIAYCESRISDNR